MTQSTFWCRDRTPGKDLTYEVAERTVKFIYENINISCKNILKNWHDCNRSVQRKRKG